jgi:hypothetical protein
MQTAFSAQVDIFDPKISAVLRKMEFVNSHLDEALARKTLVGGSILAAFRPLFRLGRALAHRYTFWADFIDIPSTLTIFRAHCCANSYPPAVPSLTARVVANEHSYQNDRAGKEVGRSVMHLLATIRGLQSMSSRAKSPNPKLAPLLIVLFFAIGYGFGQTSIPAFLEMA